MSTTDVMKKNIFILVVEDSPTQAKMLKHSLESLHYAVHLCCDGEEAYVWLQSTELKPDIIISDIQMPRMDGYQLCKAVRTNEAFRDIPVILLTVLTEPLSIIQSIEAGGE